VVIIVVTVTDIDIYICDSIHNPQYCLFADDVQIYRCVKNVVDRKLFQCDIGSLQYLFLDNGMKPNLDKITIISLTRKTNSVYLSYLVSNHVTVISRSQCVNHLGIHWAASSTAY
jgi:hypothetical protein